MSQPNTIEASQEQSNPQAVVRSQDAVVRCPECAGYGYFVDLEFVGEECRKVAYKCKKCDGTGNVPVTPNPNFQGTTHETKKED